MAKKIKVLQLGSSSGLYGAEHWILALIKYLDPNVIESYVGSILDTPSSTAPICDEAQKRGYPAYKIDSYGKLNLAAVGKLRRFIKDYKIDIIHTHGYKTDLIGLLATMGTPCKIVSTPHGWTQQPDLKLFLYEALDRLIFPFLDAVVPLSTGIYKPLERIPVLKRKLHLIMNGVDIGEIDSLSVSSDESNSLRTNASYIIGYIGRLTAGKGLDVLFKAIAEKSERNWKVVIVGDGEQEAELKSLVKSLNISEKVDFKGFRQDRLSLLKCFDVFVLPSRSEGIPRCLMEAMSANVPVIASDIPGCRNLIDGTTTGLLFKMDNHLELAKLLDKLYHDKNCRMHLIENGKRYILEHYSAQRMAYEYQELFVKVVSAT